VPWPKKLESTAFWTLGRLVERHNGFLKHASYQKAVEQENQGASDTPSSPVK